MTDYVRLGAVWAQSQRHAHATQDVLLDGVTLKATFNSSDSFVEQGGHKINTTTYSFIFRASDLVDNGLSIKRGMAIVHEGVTYSVEYNKKVLFEDNDPYGLDIIVYASKRPTG